MNVLQNRFFAPDRCRGCGFENTLVLILNKNPGFAKPPISLFYYLCKIFLSIQCFLL